MLFAIGAVHYGKKIAVGQKRKITSYFINTERQDSHIDFDGNIYVLLKSPHFEP